MSDADPDAATNLARELRRRHQALLSRNLETRVPLDDIEKLTKEIIEAGALVPAGRDRDRLRNMLFFWTAERASRESRDDSSGAAALRTSSDTAEPARALPELRPYKGDDTLVLAPTAEHPIRPSSLIDRELSDEQLAELHKTRVTLRIAALARQYRTSAGPLQHGYLLSGPALEEARSIMDRDPDIHALVVASDARVRREKWVQRGFILLGLAGCWLVWDQMREANSDREKLEAASTARQKERQEVFGKLRSALKKIEAGDPEPLRKFVKDYGDADAGEQASIVARTQDESTGAEVVMQLQTAVDALRAGDAKPVIALSREIAHPLKSAKLAQIELAAKTPQQATLAPSKARPPALDAPKGNDAPACDGWLWLGSDENRKVSGDDALATLKPGDRVTVTANDDMRLRAGKPNADYTMADAIGLVAVKSEVVLTGAPITYMRPSGLTQYWAPVKTARPFCTRVFIQYAGDDVERLGRLRDALIAKGEFVPPPQPLAAAKSRAEIRYYRPEDAAAAKATAAELTRLTGRADIVTHHIAEGGASGMIDALIDLRLIR